MNIFFKIKSINSDKRRKMTDPVMIVQKKKKIQYRKCSSKNILVKEQAFH